MDSLRSLVNKIQGLNEILEEDKGHLDHPEDLIFTKGSEGALKAISAIVETTKNPDFVTIKWDGYPALIFGRGPTGKFSIMDKHMFNKKDGTGRQVFSPEQFIQYDAARGVDRSSLYPIIQTIWAGLAKEDQNPGFYWGDLLFSQPLQEDNGLYKFRANPNGIAYTVDANSEVGKLLKGRSAGIAVHQFIQQNAATTDEAQTLNGTIGQLKNNSNVAIVPSKMPISPKLQVSAAQVKKAQALIMKYGAAVDKLLVAPAGTMSTFNGNLFTVYINRKVVAGNFQNLLKDFMEFFNARAMSPAAKAKITEHLRQNREGLVGAFMIWSAIYNLKAPIVKQLDKASAASPVKGYLQDGTQTQEGFVAYGLKFVDRMGFSRQNLAARG
jgi:hypothetical protein